MKSGITLIETVIVLAIVSVIWSSGSFILFSRYRDMVFSSSLQKVISAISENRNQSMLAASSSLSSIKTDIPESFHISNLEHLHFYSLSGSPQGTTMVIVSDGSHIATITINSEGGISY